MSLQDELDGCRLADCRATDHPRAMRFDPDRVKTRTPGRRFMNFSRFLAFSAITGPAERKNSLQMRRFQTISEFSHGLAPFGPFADRNGSASVGWQTAVPDFARPVRPMPRNRSPLKPRHP